MTHPHGVGMLYFSSDAETAVSPHYLVSVTKTIVGVEAEAYPSYSDLHEPVFGNAGMWMLQLTRN
jgi:hypothetical protein